MLSRLPLFALLTEVERGTVQPWTQVRSYPARAVIMKQGENGEGLYLVLAGRVNVVIEDTHGHKVIVDTLEENETFSELALFQRSASLLTFECQRGCEILYVPRKALADVLNNNCAAAMYIARALAHRLESSYRKCASLAHDDVYARVMEILLTRGHERDGTWYVESGAEAISGMVGASREMVTRVMKDLVTRGIVRRHKRKIVVDSRAALEQWATQRRNLPHHRKAARSPDTQNTLEPT